MKKQTNQKNEQSFEVKPTKFFWAYWVLAACCLALGVFLLPVWNNTGVFWSTWASEGLGILLFILITVYVIYSIGGVKKDDEKLKNAIKITEILLLVVIALLCMLQQFDVVNFVGPCFVLGAVLWLRGMSCSLIAYKYNVKKKDRTIGVILGGLLAVSLGAILMVRRFTAPIFIWIISIALILVAVCTVIFGFMAIPKKGQQEQSAK